MRISDWSSDVCSSDLLMNRPIIFRLWQDRRGAFAPIAAIVMTVLLGFGALTVDMGFNYYTRNKLQVTADASALAGAQELDVLIEDDDPTPDRKSTRLNSSH